MSNGHPFPSQGWADAFKDAVNANETYRKHGKPWTFGKVAMAVKAEPGKGIPEDAGFILDVHEGQCRGIEYREGMDAMNEAPFVIVADYQRWLTVIGGEVDPIKAMMEGKLKLVKGALPTMLRFVESSRALVNSATEVATDLDAPPERPTA
jgi:putative sterol carrier protein